MSLPTPSPDALIRDPFYARLKERLVESTGLAYYADKDLDLARRIGHRLTNAGLADCGSYLERLGDPILGPTELDALIAEIAIGETYFFRHSEHFDALRNHVLPALMARNRITRSLRIWCAGCADGSEPYSLAILLRHEMAEQLAGWEVRILGTDISRHSLARAREGEFPDWALRATPERLKRQCFSKERNLWRLNLAYRQAVSFEYHNLVEHPFPSLTHNLSAFDLIVCRNVMIYFDAELMRRMILQFHECLVPGAWLLVGPSEPNMTFFRAFRTANLPGLTLYQRPEGASDQEWDASAQPAGAALFAFRELPPSPVAEGGQSASGKSKVECDAIPPPVREAVPACLPDKQKATLEMARVYADRGAWEDAARCCEDLLEADPLNSRAHFCRGLVLDQMKRHASAEQSLRRAIYLDRQFVPAHYYLGLALQSRGQAGDAARCFENTLHLLAATPADHPFAEADGITARELGTLATMHLAILREKLCSA